jgi:hypothetical protein
MVLGELVQNRMLHWLLASPLLLPIRSLNSEKKILVLVRKLNYLPAMEVGKFNESGVVENGGYIGVACLCRWLFQKD